jgi:phytoene synthase
MSEVDAGVPAASFEAKWIAAYPELELALRFVAPADRAAQSAFACLVHELEHAAFGIRDAEPATLKLHWWMEEFARARAGEARHPLTRALAAHPGFGAVPAEAWPAVVAGAFAQRDPQAAADRDALLEQTSVLYQPLAMIEAALFGVSAPESIARARSLAHALRETATLDESLRDGRLPLPLDLLARHRLARGDLAGESPSLVAALQEWFAGLASGLGSLRVDGPLLAAGVASDRWRARRAGRAGQPLESLRADLGRLPLRAAWAAWRAARRAPRRRPGH